jgi:hypothetical protein
MRDDLEGKDIDVNDDSVKVVKSFDKMGLREDLLRGSKFTACEDLSLRASACPCVPLRAPACPCLLHIPPLASPRYTLCVCFTHADKRLATKGFEG